MLDIINAEVDAKGTLVVVWKASSEARVSVLSSADTELYTANITAGNQNVLRVPPGCKGVIAHAEGVETFDPKVYAIKESAQGVVPGVKLGI